MNFLKTLFKKKKLNPLDFFIDEIDVDNHYFYNFLDVYVVQNRVLRLSKCSFRDTYSMKE